MKCATSFSCFLIVRLLWLNHFILVVNLLLLTLIFKHRHTFLKKKLTSAICPRNLNVTVVSNIEDFRCQLATMQCSLPTVLCNISGT